jgi:hypothetical protein
LYGFPIDYVTLTKTCEKILPLEPGSTEEEKCGIRRRQLAYTISYLCGVCNDVWVEMKPGYSKGLGYCVVLALFVCTRPNKKFIPEDEKLEELMKILAQEGFTEEPRWSLMVN